MANKLIAKERDIKPKKKKKENKKKSLKLGI